MAGHMFGAKPLSQPMLPYFSLEPKEQTSVKFQSKLSIVIKEHTFENAVCKKAAIWSGPGCVQLV